MLHSILKPSFVWVACLILCPFLAQAQSFKLDTDIDNPPLGILSDDWAELFINGDKVGYAHTLMERSGGIITTREETFIKVGRGPSAIATTTASTVRERIDGTPLSIITVTQEAGRTKTQRIQFESNRAIISTDDGIRSWTNEFDLDPGFVVSWGFVRALEKADLNPGDSIDTQVYVPDLVLGQAITATTTLIQNKSAEIDGEERQLLQFGQVLQLGFLPVSLTAWVDEDGSLIEMIMPLGGMEITMIGTTKESATAQFSPPDLFTDTLISLNRSIPENAAKVVFEVDSGTAESLSIPDTAHQTVIQRNGGVFEVEVIKTDLRVGGTSPVDPLYLKPSPLVDYDDPAIQDLVSDEELGELSFADQVRRLVEIVDSTISVKSMDFGFATASETVALSEGDCTEHALLFAALARSVGIPARGAMGIVYFIDDEGKPVMGYHMWNQVWNGEEWLDVDAAFRTAEPSPIRVLFGTSDLSDPNMAQEILSFAQYLGQTDIKVLRVE